MTALLSARSITHRYPETPRDVLVDVSLEVGAGDIVGILGPNGAGKSTLLRILAGLLVPDRGTVALEGADVHAMARNEVARRMALVPQQEPVVFEFSGREVVAMGRSPHTGMFGTLTADDRAIVDDAIARCGATAFADRRMAQLSGGEQKRLILARALAQRAPLLLLDEPVAFLDVHQQLALCSLVATGAASGTFTAVAVLHDLNLAAQFCTRLVLLRGGTVVASGTVEEVMTYQRIRDTFDADVYVGVNEVNGTRFFVPMR